MAFVALIYIAGLIFAFLIFWLASAIVRSWLGSLALAVLSLLALCLAVYFAVDAFFLCTISDPEAFKAALNSLDTNLGEICTPPGYNYSSINAFVFVPVLLAILIMSFVGARQDLKTKPSLFWMGSGST